MSTAPDTTVRCEFYPYGPKSRQNPRSFVRPTVSELSKIKAKANQQMLNMIPAESEAPDFTLLDQNGIEFTLSELKGTPVVLYFYPKDDTPGCTREACAFRDARSDYEAVGARVVGVSPDGVETHKKFETKYELPFTLLADPDHQVCELYGVWQEKNNYGKKSMGVVRSTFVIDADRIVRKFYPRVKVDGHSDKILEILRGL